MFPFGGFNEGEYKLTPNHERLLGHSKVPVLATEDDADAWTCSCRDYIGAQKGEAYRITNEAVMNDANPDNQKKLIQSEYGFYLCSSVVKMSLMYFLCLS